MKRQESSYPLTERVSPDTRHITTPSEKSPPQRSERCVSIPRLPSAVTSANSAREKSALIVAFPPLGTNRRESVDHGLDTAKAGREEPEDSPQKIQRRLTFL